MQRPHGVLLLLLVLTASLLLFWNLEEAPLERWDELTNINVVQETRSGGHLLPVLGGKPFLEKPPLWYLLTSALTSFTGDHLFWYRSVSAFSGLGCVLLLVLIVKRTHDIASGLASGFTLLSVVHLFVPSVAGLFSSHTFRSADLDALQLFLLCAAWFVFRSEHKRKIAFTSILIGCAYLVKGPLALGLLGVCVFTLYRRRAELRTFAELVLPAAVLAGLWFCLMFKYTSGGIWDSYILYHQLARISGIEMHVEPVWFYILILAHPLTNPAALPAGIAWLRSLKSGSLAAVSAAALLAGLSFILTKLSWYVFPVYILLALITGRMYRQFALPLQILLYVAVAAGILQSLWYVIRL
ncbi:MAG: hypothetical protein TR69_WS6001001103 [candidate division WS6 bacterium OLB20]|uniref:Uncharacterized protein n=1 Tax=candidate division WS6 bacterium OLB20 TaxID=1617426 RepID=A0A136LZK7_9BACT|nr:MAG: hypothetical protein TR69_WS6001001103 [candidate division WS6 bacterium OLB20]